MFTNKRKEEIIYLICLEILTINQMAKYQIEEMLITDGIYDFIIILPLIILSNIL
jgi:hypothetical protein